MLGSRLAIVASGHGSRLDFAIKNAGRSQEAPPGEFQFRRKDFLS
jgi:hypothetical protein